MIKKLLKRFVYRLRGEYTLEQLIKMGLSVGKEFNPQLGVSLDPSHCWLISIGDNVTMAPHVQVFAHDAGTCAHLGYARLGRVDIGNRVFIGASTVILPGVSIGDDCIIGAGSVVSKSIPSGTVYAGNPARMICTTEEYINKHRALMNAHPIWDESYTLRLNITPEKKDEQKQSLRNNGVGYVQ